MTKTTLLLSAALCLGATGSYAQATTSTTPEVAVPNQTAAQQTGQGPTQGEIIVTATRRADRLSNVPIAISVVTSAALQNSGATDIRQLNQLSPSLLVSSTSSETTGGAARIRGIGTVGDNPGLESSVATFIDGVYRSRSGAALTELGAVERVEVLRGPQGTLFGRNASAGLINIITQKPSFETSGDASFSYGNYDYYRGEFGITGPILGGDKLAARLDGVYVNRKGFNKDVISGKRSNDRDRFLVRAQLLFRPTDALNIRLIGDYAERTEQCCSAVFQPLNDVVRAPGTAPGSIGDISLAPAALAAFERSLKDPAGNPVILNDSGNRDVSVTPGRDYHSNVIDWGGSGEVNWDLGGINLTSITAYRLYQTKRGQDADYTNLDLLYRSNFKQQFRTFSQELRAQGEAFNGHLNYLVGGYFANEDLYLRDDLHTGSQLNSFANALVGFGVPSLAPFNAFPGGIYGNLPTVVNLSLLKAGAPAPVAGLFASQVAPLNLSNSGEVDNYHQNSKNYAIFTHNQIKIVDSLTLTLGARYTSEEKTLDATLLTDGNGACASLLNSIGKVKALGANPLLAGIAANLAGTLTALAALPCASNLSAPVDGTYHDRKKEDKFTGTAVLSWKPVDSLLLYGSYSRGYKAGGFNLDRAPLSPVAPSLTQLRFQPETVDAYEIGAKFSRRKFNLNVALFREDLENFQLNTFNGVSFVVVNVEGCKNALGAPAPGQLFGSCAASASAAGVRSEGVELEASIRPAPTVSINAGLTYASTKYRTQLTGFGGAALANSFFLLPGNRISNAPEYTVTSSAAWTPTIPGTNLSALFYIDTRLQSDINTGSDLAPAKIQDGFILTNARVALRGPGQRWSVEFWGQNIFDTVYTQVAFDAPLQGSVSGGRVSTLGAGTTYAANRSSNLYGRFLGEPRTFGVTLRTRF